MSNPIVLYTGQIVQLLAAAGISRHVIDIEDDRYVLPTESWFFNEGLPAYKRQSPDGLDEAWDCDEFADDLKLFMRKCGRQLGLKMAPAVFRIRYLPERFPWGKQNDLWTKHVNNVAVIGASRVVFIEPQLNGPYDYQPSQQDLDTIEHCRS